MTRFEFPEETKALAMPSEQGFRFEDKERFFPILDAAGKEHKPEAIGWRKGGLFDLAAKKR